MTKQPAKDISKPTEFGVEQRMNKAFIDPGGASTASIAVQSPDAVDRNLALGAAAGESASSAVQSPDAAARNLAYSAPGGVEPRDVAPVWIGDGSEPLHTFSGDDNAGPAAGGVATDEGQLTNGVEQHMAPITGEGDLSQ